MTAAIFGCAGTRLTAAEKRFFAQSAPFGFILFARNLETPEQIRALCDDLRQSVGRAAPILIDQEGGRVARLKPPMWLGWLAALDQMARTRPGNARRAMWLRSRLIAHELVALGIDVNCAPIADIPMPGVHPIIQNRCYGYDVPTVVDAARGVADGLLAGGVVPVLKHIPGHGRPNADSHTELPRTSARAGDLQSIDFAAFRALNDLPMGMTAHVVYEAFDQDACATLSPTMVGIIRTDIGFDGLLMSDDLSMSALSGSLSSRARLALAAGCDVVLHCNGALDEMRDIAAASGAMTDVGAMRGARALAARKTPDEIDPRALLSELDDLLMLSGDDKRDPT